MRTPQVVKWIFNAKMNHRHPILAMIFSNLHPRLKSCSHVNLVLIWLFLPLADNVEKNK